MLQRDHGIANANLGFAEARQELLRLMCKRDYAALATTALDRQPEAAPLRYAVSDDFELVMGTLASSRKVRNLRANPKVAVLVWDHEFSIQIEGAFDEPTGAELERLKGLFASEFPREFQTRQGRAAHFYFRIRPAWARYSDFSQDPARVLTLDFASETETRGTWPVVNT